MRKLAFFAGIGAIALLSATPSFAQLGGAHLACENIYNVVAKFL